MASRRQPWTTLRRPWTTLLLTMLAVIVLLAGCAGGAAPAATSQPAGNSGAKVSGASSGTGSSTSSGATQSGATGASGFVVEPGKAPPPPSNGKTYSDAEWAKIVDAAKKEGKVMQYGTFGADYDPKLVAAFKKATGLDLQIVAGTTNVLAERVKNEYRANVYQADTIYGQGSIQAAELDGYLARIDDMPVFSNPNDPKAWYVNPLVSPVIYQTYAYPHCGIMTINTNVIPADKYPKKFQDLTDPFFKGKIQMDDPATSITPDTTIWGWYAGLGFPDWYLDAAYDLYNKGAGFIQIGTERDLVRGLTGLLPAMRGTTGAMPEFYAESQGIKNLKVIQFSQQPVACSSTIMMGVSVFNKAPHPNAALVWSDWFIGKDGQTAWTQARPVASIRKDIPEPIKQAYWPVPEATHYWNIDMDWMNFMNEAFGKKIAFNLIKQGMSRQAFKDAMKQVSMDHFKQFPPPPRKMYSADQFYKGMQ